MDLCAGPHVASTGKVKNVKIMSVAGAYWRGSEKNKMLQRIYATAFEKKADLDEYIETLKYVFNEAYTNPEYLKAAPHSSVCHQLDESNMDDPEQWAVTWRAYRKKYQ